ncbi:hypothetical protein EX30DRAFT_367140 [Ascodesmis nigricans]|uniref:Uncharacterized protein n=1 Tax=Ascodesmis nigricans TaxID=341454 RepID=A0A4S2MIL6_9PEZI|nr:hypothetical protein EX30DRAFT_367140 [Ascodesmis nigricans]
MRPTRQPGNSRHARGESWLSLSSTSSEGSANTTRSRSPRRAPSPPKPPWNPQPESSRAAAARGTSDTEFMWTQIHDPLGHPVTPPGMRAFADDIARTHAQRQPEPGVLPVPRYGARPQDTTSPAPSYRTNADTDSLGGGSMRSSTASTSAGPRALSYYSTASQDRRSNVYGGQQGSSGHGRHGSGDSDTLGQFDPTRRRGGGDTGGGRGGGDTAGGRGDGDTAGGRGGYY